MNSSARIVASLALLSLTLACPIGADPADAIQRFAQSTRRYDLRYKGLLRKLFLPIGDLSQALAGIEEIFDSTQVADLAVGAPHD